MKSIAKQLPTILLFIIALMLGSILTRMSMSPVPNAPLEPLNVPQQQQQQSDATATETIPPSTPLATLTPSRTLKPPPTFEPPTNTVMPSSTPSVTPTPTIDLSISIPGLHGAETPTPSTTPGCEKRDDWKLTYEVKRDDALEKIANLYNTNVSELAAGNCITDVNLIAVGQVLRVPGDVPPPEQVYDCSWELLTPVDGTLAIEATGMLTFNWRGPQAPINLIRIIKPDGSTFERVVELRQNEQVSLLDIPEQGTYTWYVYPLDSGFRQIACK
ncbi:MAG: LysM peptidoglycan-binding domain-containing protein, partial [Anaerolineae bacterium]|nr:LysM peptidoglycan-binding domain-containing protein [Anaerolineae bacterium]